MKQNEACQAIQKYKQFLALCITSTNTQGEAMAGDPFGPGGDFQIFQSCRVRVGLSAVGL
jgi:hypothetical protein